MFDTPEDHFQWLTELCDQAGGARADLMYGDELVYFVGEEMFCLFHLEDGRKVSMAFRPHPEKRDEQLSHPLVEEAAFPAEGCWLHVPEAACTAPPPDGISREDLADWVKASYEQARSG